MIRSTDAPNPTDLVAGYILDDLSPEEATLLNEALSKVPELYEDIESFGEAFALLPYDMPILEPSTNLKDKIINAASHSITASSTADHAIPNHVPESSLPNVVPINSPRRRSWQRWIPAISSGIAAVAVVALGLNQIQFDRQSQLLEATNTELERLRNELQSNQAAIARLSQPDSQVYALIGATSNPKNSRLATARLFAKPGDINVTLVAQDLPKLSNNQIYRLWAVAKPSAAPMYCGEFRQDDSGTAQWVAPNAACTLNPSQLLITRDAPTDPITSAGPLVMRSLS